jgi:hypothetical protein
VLFLNKLILNSGQSDADENQQSEENLPKFCMRQDMVLFS